MPLSYIGIHHIMTFAPVMNSIYDSGPILEQQFPNYGWRKQLDRIVQGDGMCSGGICQTHWADFFSSFLPHVSLYFMSQLSVCSQNGASYKQCRDSNGRKGPLGIQIEELIPLILSIKRKREGEKSIKSLILIELSQWAEEIWNFEKNIGEGKGIGLLQQVYIMFRKMQQFVAGHSYPNCSSSITEQRHH